MTPVQVVIDLERIRVNARAIQQQVRVPILAMVKADAYGLGLGRVLPAIDPFVKGYCVFRLSEARSAKLLERTGKRTIVLSPDGPSDASAYLQQGARPAVADIVRAGELADADPVLAVDTGMQRFACPPDHIGHVIAAGNCREAFTHATTLAQVNQLKEVTAKHRLILHAAGSSLLHEPAARLDAVRPGLALYRGVARVSCQLVEATASNGPIGYTGWKSTTGFHGVILAGYTNGLRAGPCSLNGRRARIMEVGMQSAFVEIADGDRIGDEVILLGEDVTAESVSAAWKTSPQEVIVKLTAAGPRTYIHE